MVLRWRVGRHLGRTLYQCTPDGKDEFLGIMDSPAMAAWLVALVNAEGDYGPTHPTLDALRATMPQVGDR